MIVIDSKMVRLCGFVVCASVLASPLEGQAATPAWTWTDKAELTFVWTAGNAVSNTFGVKNVLTGKGGRSRFLFEASAVRTESTTRMRTAVGTATQFTLNETTTSETTAESYAAKGRYDHNLSSTALVSVGVGWNRNTFSGIDSRWSIVTGVGNQWVDTDELKFRTDLGATYTIENNVAGADGTAKFFGARASWELLRQLTETATFNHSIVVDENAKETTDLRADMTNSLTVSINSRFALKTSHQLLFDNNPSFAEVPLESSPGVPTGQTVLAELRKFDSVFTVALVINF